MVIVMFKFVLHAAALATLVLAGVMTSQAAPYAARHACTGNAAATVQQSCPRGALQEIRDVQTARSRGNGCWNACFNDFDECMGVRTKDLCVSRVKTCLETCDRLSNRPGM